MLTLVADSDAVLVKVNVPVDRPDDWGLKLRIMEAVLPEGIARGSDIPLMANSALLRLADSTVTGPPAAKRVSTCFWLVPTTTGPKFIAIGLSLSCPDITPAPPSGTETLVLDAFDSIESCPA
jgi:hypothetical protein